MAVIRLNPAFVETNDVKQTGKYLFDAQDGSTPVELVVWLEKSKATEKHPDGKPWIKLPKDNITNRAYFSEDLFLASAVDGEVVVEIKTAAPRVLGATGIKQEIIDFLSEEDANEYTGLVQTALDAFKAAKENSKKKKPEEMSKAELEVYIEALRTGSKYTPASAPKSFLEMFTQDQYNRYNELLAKAAEAKANAPKAQRAPLSEEQKAQRAVKRQQTELSKAQKLLQALEARAMQADLGPTITVDDEDFVDEDLA